MTIQITIWIASVWFLIWWLYAIYDVFSGRIYHFITNDLWGYKISQTSQDILNVLLFPIYVLYHCVIFILRGFQYVCIDIFYEMIIMGLVRLVGIVFKGLFHIITRLID